MQGDRARHKSSGLFRGAPLFLTSHFVIPFDMFATLFEYLPVSCSPASFQQFAAVSRVLWCLSAGFEAPQIRPFRFSERFAPYCFPRFSYHFDLLLIVLTYWGKNIFSAFPNFALSCGFEPVTLMFQPLFDWCCHLSSSEILQSLSICFAPVSQTFRSLSTGSSNSTFSLFQNSLVSLDWFAPSCFQNLLVKFSSLTRTVCYCSSRVTQALLAFSPLSETFIFALCQIPKCVSSNVLLFLQALFF